MFPSIEEFTFSPEAMVSAKSSSIDNNESNMPSWKSLAHIESKKSLAEFGVQKNELIHFVHIFCFTKKFTFSP